MNPGYTVKLKKWIGDDPVVVTYRYLGTKYGRPMFGGLDRFCSFCSNGDVASASYDAAGNINHVTDFRGSVTDYEYNSRGLETKRVDAANASGADAATKRTTETAWNTAFNVPDQRAIKNAAGTVESLTRWTYNSRGQATARCGIDPAISGATGYTCGSSTNAPVGVRQSLTTYCEASDVAAGTCPLVGLVTSVNGPRLTSDAGMAGDDDITTYTYYPADDSTCATNGACPHRKGDLWKVANALGHTVEYLSYDKSGRVTRQKDANGTITDFAYHVRGWLTDRIVRANANGKISANDAALHMDYDAVGNVTRVTQPDGDYLDYFYDAAHRLVKISNNLGESVDYCPGGVGSAQCLDAAGNRRVEQVKDASGNIKRQLHRVYNQLGQLTQVLNAAGTPVETSVGIAGTGIADGYDGNGNRVLKDDGLGIRTGQDYDPLNRLKATIQDLGGTDPATQDATTAYTYDARDNLRQVTDPDDLNTVYDYDSLNNLTGLHSPDTGYASYTYDAAGNRKTQTDARGVTSTYTYDALNRLIGISYPTTSLDVAYVYDQKDAITGCTGDMSIGRLSVMMDASGTTTYCYDRHGNVSSKTQVTNNTTAVTQYAYTRGDRMAAITYPGGGVAVYGRDALGRVQSLRWYVNSFLPPRTIIGATTYLPFGPLTTLAYGNGRTQIRAYDQDYAIDTISGSPAGTLSLDLGVDVMGDITSASATIGASPADRVYRYDPLHRLTTAKTGVDDPLEAYTYNKTGDRLSASLNGAVPTAYAYGASSHRLGSVGTTARTYDDNGNTLTGALGVPGFTFTYDDRNRLATATQGTTVVTNQYNGRGERVSKTTAVSGSGPTVRYVYDEAGRLLVDGDSQYLYLDELPVAVIRAGVVHYVEVDHLGTPRAVVKPGATPAADVTLWRWSLLGNSFGADAPQEDADGDGKAFVMNLRFPGQYFDAETGLHYNHFRDYEHGVGRYIESDPIGLKTGINTYVYVGSNPLLFRDIHGLARWQVIDSLELGAAIGIGGKIVFVDLKSGCNSHGERYKIKVVAVGPSAGLGLDCKYCFTAPPKAVIGGEFEDHSGLDPNPNAFDGPFLDIQASAHIGGLGPQWSQIVLLGQATSPPGFSFAMGFGSAGLEVSGTIGTSTVLSIKPEPCCQ